MRPATLPVGEALLLWCDIVAAPILMDRQKCVTRCCVELRWQGEDKAACEVAG